MKVVIRYTALENEEGPIESPAMREVEHKFKARIASVRFLSVHCQNSG